jgi:hypothetical protein
MTRTPFLLLCATLALPADSASAQARPDFSGRWTSVPPDSVVQAPRGGRGGRGGRAGDLGSGWGNTITIAQDANRLTVEYAFFTRGDMQPPLRFVYALDGSETKNSVMMGRGIQVQTSKTAWNGEQLVITTLHTFENPQNGQPAPIEVKQTLTLESPASLIVETTRSGVMGGPPSTTRTTYRKL